MTLKFVLGFVADCTVPTPHDYHGYLITQRSPCSVMMMPLEMLL